MTAFFVKQFGKSLKKCVNGVTNCNRVTSRKANFHTTRRNFQLKCDDGPIYTTRLALPPDYDNVVDFMCDAYYKYEPVVVNIGLTDPEAPALWRQMMRHQVSAGMSLIAEDRDHCIVGAALNIKTCRWEGEHLRELARCCADGRMRRLVEFFGFVADQADLWNCYGVKTIFEQGSVAVRGEFQGLGIATTLMRESWLLARDCGYRLFRMDCNSRYCAKICEGFGWKRVWSMPFSQYVRDGEIVFKNVKEPHTMCQVYVDTLEYRKTFCPPYKRGEKVAALSGKKT